MPSTTLADPRGTQARDDHGPGFGIYVAFVPWLLFTVITRHSSLEAAAAVALAASGIIAVPSLLKGRPKLLELGAVLVFAGFTAVAFTADAPTSEWLVRYARAIAAGGLAVISFVSLVFVPFTEQYARETVPREFWGAPQFRQVNRRLTTMWAWVFVAMVPAHLIAGAIDTHRADTVFNWVIPGLLIVWAVKRTAAVAAAAAAAEA